MAPGLRRALAALTLAAGALALAAPALAQAVVVRASGPSAAKFPKGAKLAAGATVRLEAGDVVTVLDKAGSRILKGKGDFTIDSRVLRDRGMTTLLTRSLNNPQTVRAGAVRGVTLSPETAPTLPGSVWLADIDKGGKVCVPQGSDLYLWRANADARRLAWLGEAEGGSTVRLLFPQRTWGIAWPSATIPPIGGRSYRLTDDPASDRAIDFEVVTLAPDMIPADAAGLAALLLDSGCAAQFDMLAASLERMEAEPPLE